MLTNECRFCNTALHLSLVMMLQNIGVLCAVVVVPSISEKSSGWMLHFAQHDSDVMPSTFVMPSTSFVSFRSLFSVIPSEARNPVWMLRFTQHDKKGKCASFSMTAMSFRAQARNPVYGCFTSLRSVQHDSASVKALKHNWFNSYSF